MFDFSKFNRIFEEHRFEFWFYFSKGNPLPSSLNKYEIDAFLKYKEIDKKKLKEYFTEVISQGEKSSSENAEDFYTNKLNQIKKSYKSSGFATGEIEKLNKSIYDTFYSDSGIYKRAKKSVDKNEASISLNESVAEQSFKIIDNLELNILKLIAITNFKSEAEKAILFIKLNKKYVENTFESFKDIFVNENEFDNILKLLIGRKDVIKTDAGFSWDGSLKAKTSICVLSLILQKRNYYKITPPDKLIVDLLNQFFDNSSDDNQFTNKYYGNIRRKFPLKVNDSLEKYESHFYYIPKYKE